MIGYEDWGFALVHFLWQGILVGATLAVVLRALASTGPEVRYCVSVAALLLMAALPTITFWSMEVSRGTDTGASEVVSLQPLGGSAESDGRRERPAANPLATDRASAPDVTDAVGAPGGTRVGASSRIEWARALIQPYLAWIVALWILGVLILSTRLLGGWIQLRRLTRVDVLAVPVGVRKTATQLAERLSVSRPVRLLRSARVSVPAVVGWVRPVILLPASALTGLTPAQLESILAHELAHIRRHDYLVNLFQTIVETVLFYHPAVWWVSRRIREEREHCCDDLALSVCGDRRLYVGALLELETLRSPSPQLAVGADGGSLAARARRLLRPNSPRKERLPRAAAALSTTSIAVVMAAACVGGPLISVAPRIVQQDADPNSAMVFIGEAFADKVFRYEVSIGGDAALDHEITTNVSQPGGIAFGPTGEMFISNRSGSVARYLDPTRTATPNGLITAEDTEAPFGQPHWLTFRGGELFLAQGSGVVLRFVFDQSGQASFNGTLTAGSSSRGIQTGPTGELFVSNLENSIRRFAFDGEGDASPSATVLGAGTGLHGMTFAPWGELLVADFAGDRISRFTFDAQGRAVPNGVIAGGDMVGPIDLDFSPWGELFVTNHNQVPGVVTRWIFEGPDPSAGASYNGSFEVPGNLGGIRFAAR